MPRRNTLSLLFSRRILVQESDEGFRRRRNGKLLIDDFLVLQSAAIDIAIIADILAQRGTLKRYSGKNAMRSRP